MTKSIKRQWLIEALKENGICHDDLYDMRIPVLDRGIEIVYGKKFHAMNIPQLKKSERDVPKIINIIKSTPIRPIWALTANIYEFLNDNKYGNGRPICIQTRLQDGIIRGYITFQMNIETPCGGMIAEIDSNSTTHADKVIITFFRMIRNAYRPTGSNGLRNRQELEIDLSNPNYLFEFENMADLRKSLFGEK